MSWTSFCCINDDSLCTKTLKVFLNEDLGLSGQAIKKSELSHDELRSKIYPKKLIKLPLNLVNKGNVSPIYTGPEVEILFEDELFIAVNKPEGIHQHPLVYSDTLNLLSFLRSKGKLEVLNVFPLTHERGWLYRLDRETSGVLVGVKDAEVYENYRKNFSSKTIRKRYLCLVEGDVLKKDEVDLYLEAHLSKGSKMRASFDQTRGRRARMRYRPLFRSGQWTLLEVDLLSGVRHQIRASLAFLGHPIIGDQLYGAKESTRVFLHAYEYQLRRDHGEVLKVKSSLSGVFEPFLDLNGLLQVLDDESLIR